MPEPEAERIYDKSQSMGGSVGWIDTEHTQAGFHTATPKPAALEVAGVPVLENEAVALSPPGTAPVAMAGHTRGGQVRLPLLPK